MLKKPDLSMALNGFLAGLVGITAGADAISPAMSLVAGGVAGAVPEVFSASAAVADGPAASSPGG